MQLFPSQWSSGEVSQWYVFLQHSYACPWLRFITSELLNFVFFLVQTLKFKFLAIFKLSRSKIQTLINITILPSTNCHLRLSPLFIFYISSLTKSVCSALELPFDFILNFPFIYVHIQVKPWSSLTEILPPPIQYTLIKIIFLSNSKLWSYQFLD